MAEHDLVAGDGRAEVEALEHVAAQPRQLRTHEVRRAEHIVDTMPPMRILLAAGERQHRRQRIADHHNPAARPKLRPQAVEVRLQLQARGRRAIQEMAIHP